MTLNNIRQREERNQAEAEKEERWRIAYNRSRFEPPTDEEVAEELARREREKLEREARS